MSRAAHAAALAVAAALCGSAPAQRPANTDLGSAFEALLQELSQQPATPVAERIAAVRAFLQVNQALGSEVWMLRARLRLGALHLEAFDAESARMVFAAVRELAPPGDYDLHGRALYGLAQAQELHGNRATARETLDILIQELPGTRYAAWAVVARRLLDREGPLRPGHALPPLHGGEAIDGSLCRPARMRGPLLLVVFAPDHGPSMERLLRLQEIWTEGGLSPESLIAYAVGGKPDRLRRNADQRGLRCTIVPCPDGFLHPDLLALGIGGVPASLVVGSDHVVLLRDPPPDRLRLLLQKAR